MKKVILAGLIFIILAGAGIIYWATRPPSNPDVNILNKAESLVSAEASQNRYRINRENSEVEFNIWEVLGGKDFLVVGKTDQIAGEILVDPKNIKNSKIGKIIVNAKTLKTDNPNRDGAISRFILKSEKNEFELIEFNPERILGLPELKLEEITTPLEIQIIGNLTIAGVAKKTVWNGSINVINENEIKASAQTIVRYKDFNLAIPKVPFVANVNDEVTLKISLTAPRAGD